MTDEMNFKNKQGLIERFDNIKDELYITEISLELVLNHYVYGGFDNDNHQSTLPDMNQEEIYWFVLDKLVELVNKGSIYGKWLIGKELIMGQGFISQDKALGRFLIEFSAYEGQPDACNYMAQKYHDLNFGDRDIVIYWQKRADSDESIDRFGVPLPLYIHKNKTIDGSRGRMISLKSELAGEWEGYADLPRPINSK